MFFNTPLKTSENFWFSDVFKMYRKGPVAWNILIPFSHKTIYYVINKLILQVQLQQMQYIHEYILCHIHVILCKVDRN